MMPDIVIAIGESGDIVSLYSDDLDLKDIGDMTVPRASHVEYDKESGGWTVTLSSGERIGTVFTSRSEAIGFEIQYLNNRMEKYIN